MPRHRRLEIPGAVYHVITRGINKQQIFKDDYDRKEFLRRLSTNLKNTGNKCYGWVLMPNHFHLLIICGNRPLSDMMRKLLTGYAVYFNRRYDRSGYLYQNRYKSILCQEDSYLLELVRYIHLNPLRGGIVKDMNQLNKYQWSGHSVLIGNMKADWQSTDEVLELFGNNRRKSISKYIEFINDGQNQGTREDLTGGGLRRSAGGWAGVLDLKRNRIFWRGDERILGDGDFVNRVLRISEEVVIKREKLLREGWNINKVVNRVCSIMGIKEEEIFKSRKRGEISEARSLIAFLVNKELGINGSKLASHFKITKQSVCESIIRGEQLLKKYNINLST